MNEKNKQFSTQHSSLSIRTPAIRFKGFSGDWEEREMLDCSSKIGDGLHGTPKYVEDSGIYFINGNNLISGSIYITNETKQVSEKDQSKDDNALNSSTLLMSINGTIGNLAWYQGEKVMLGKSVAYITLENCDNAYMYTYLQTRKINNYFLNNITGSTIKNLGLKIIRESKISIPDKKTEQTKIGSYFQQLDTLITQHQRKHDKLLNVKKAMLEKMFPKKGAEVPEIRFKGFSEKWEERKLGEVFNYERPDPYIVESVEYSDDYDTPVLTANKGFVLGYTNETNIFNKPSIIFDDFTLDCKYVNFPYMVKSSAIKILTIKNKNTDDLEFSFNLLNTTKIEIMGHARHYIGVVQPTNIFVPLKEEQTKIGNLFKHLDTLLSLHQTELEKLKNIKKACVEKMFV